MAGENKSFPYMLRLNSRVIKTEIDISENVRGKIELTCTRSFSYDKDFDCIGNDSYEILNEEDEKTLLALYHNPTYQSLIDVIYADVTPMEAKGLDEYLHSYYLKDIKVREMILCKILKKEYCESIGYRAHKFDQYFKDQPKDSLLTWFLMIMKTSTIDDIYYNNYVIWKGFVEFMTLFVPESHMASKARRVSVALKLAKLIMQQRHENSWRIWTILVDVIGLEGAEGGLIDPIKEWLKTFA